MHVLALHIAGLAQTLAKSGYVRSGLARRRAGKKADHRHRGLLRRRRARPYEPRGTKQRDELAPLHSITSSASASSLSGTVSPSILAVEALMTSSNLLACSTGKSAGFAPLRMRPTYTPT